MSFLRILEEKGIIQKNQADLIEKEVENSNKTIEEALEERGVTSQDLLDAKKEYFNLPLARVENSVPLDVLEKVPESSALHYKFVPLGIDSEGFLEIGIINPDNMEARDAIQFISSKNNLPFKLFLISNSDFNSVISSYEGLHGEVNKALTELESEIKSEKKEKDVPKRNLSKTKRQVKIIEEAPVTKIVATILRYAAEGDASDVHIEHMEDKIRVRFRVDGVLHTSLILPANIHSAVVARIKVLANMKLDEKRKPQDGRFSAQIENRKVDFRVSTFPAYYGEKIVMRILEPEKGVRSLEEAGLSPTDLKKLKKAIEKPYGMILISGPTGSGKSTTLYSLLNEMDRETKNVLSLEDPVEFNIKGVSQSQVRPEIGYTFASGLRTTLRQDPDIIMVGEIRDRETAALAIQAALTGHLVLSTIHTNSAVGVIPRLVEMGVEPYLIAPTLILAVAQRLARRICPNSAEVIPVEGSIKVLIEKEFSNLPEEVRNKIKFSENVYRAVPSEECAVGTKGRVGVFEVIEMNKELEDSILKNGNNTDLEEIVRRQGILTMKEDAILKAFDKKIPFEEVEKL